MKWDSDYEGVIIVAILLIVFLVFGINYYHGLSPSSLSTVSKGIENDGDLCFDALDKLKSVDDISVAQFNTIERLCSDISNVEASVYVESQGLQSGICDEPLADMNEDGFVDFADVVFVLANWGPCSDCTHDIDGDGLLGFFEILEILANWHCEFPGVGEWVDPFPAEFIDTSGLYSAGFGTIQFLARDGNILTAYTYRATSFQESGKILFIQHGNSRTAESYLIDSAPIAERNSALAIAIEFSEADYPSGFTTVVGTDGTPSGRNYDPKEWRSPEDYLYSEIEHVFEAIRIEFDEPDKPGYYYWGHSAGGQFGHRLLTFLPGTPAIRAVVANSGWYTLPSFGGGNDENYYMPYGLQGTPLTDDDVRALLNSNLIVNVGEEDILTAKEDETLRDTDEANYQGTNRFERAHFYFDVGETQAEEYGVPFSWVFGLVPGAKHSKNEMLPSGGWYLFSDRDPCTPTIAAEAQNLVVNEIHADPHSTEGDANNDGTRHSSEDEFIELVNVGPTPICLTGWTITDLSSPDRERHNFRIGSELNPGKAVVVFGGGIPTGGFGNSGVHWATFEGDRLSLSNVGDVITIRDYQGTIFQRVSWGDCGGQPCGDEHITIKLDDNQAVTRWPDGVGIWRKQLDVSGFRYTPGERYNGVPF